MRKSSLAMLCLLTGCTATVKLDSTFLDRVDQMPEAVAKQVVARYMGNAWVELPHVYNAPACGAKQIPLPITQMDYAQFDAGSSHRLVFGNSKGRPFTCDEGGRIIATRATSKEQVQELVSALMSLGARFKQ